MRIVIKDVNDREIASIEEEDIHSISYSMKEHDISGIWFDGSHVRCANLRFTRLIKDPEYFDLVGQKGPV